MNITTTTEFSDSPLLADAHGCARETLPHIVELDGVEYGVYYAQTGDTWIDPLDAFRAAHERALESLESGAEPVDAYQAMHDEWDATECDLDFDDIEDASKLWVDEDVNILSMRTGDALREATDDEIKDYLADLRDSNPPNGAVSGEPFGIGEDVWLDVSNLPDTFAAIRRGVGSLR